MTLLETSSDGDLAFRAAAGDRAAFDLLVARHQGLVQAVAYGRLGNFEDARDAAQATFVAAWRGLPSLREPSRFKPWLRKLAENESLMMLRRLRPALAFEESVAEDAFGEADLRLTLESLPVAEREALTLCALHGHAVAEAAEFLGVAKTTVESRLRTARSRLRREILDITEKTLIDHRLPDDFASKLPLPYDEFDFTVRPPVPEALGEFRREWLRSSGLPEVAAFEALGEETTRVTFADGRVGLIQYTGRRGGIEDEAALLPVLRGAGVPVPSLLAPPVVDPAAPQRGAMSCVEAPVGTSLDAWAAGSGRTLHELDAACGTLLDARDAMASATEAVLAAGVRLERCTLADELARTVRLGGPWFDGPEFERAVRRLEGLDLDQGVVFSNGGNPAWTVRVDEGGALVGYWGFAWARLEDPHYGVTKMWVYDAWPFRRMGIVERYLVRNGVSRSEFGLRLAVRALATLQREVPVSREDAEEYREFLLAWLRMGLGWL